jgi:hypothetical protein
MNQKLGKILMTNSKTEINSVCALMSDFKTVNTGVAILKNKDQYDLSFPKDFNISDIGFIFYGNLPSTQKCDVSLFQMKTSN